MNHQTLIATKARRIVQAADGRTIMEFGARRAHNFDAADFGARAAYIGGVAGTATTYAGKEYGIPALGTMAHSFIQSFDTEYEAFLHYAKTYPDSCTVLLDTYNTLKSGLPNAIRVAKEYLEPNGYRLQGVRIDSGDIAYLSKKIRKQLDEAGMQDCSIVVSNSLDEYLIESLLSQGAQIDSMGVGENLVTSKSSPVFGGVYKLSAVCRGEEIIPKIKVSENIEKVTNPGMKNLYRIYDKESKKALGDIMTLHDEVIDPAEDLTIYHQMNSWKNKTIPGGSYELRDLLVPIFVNGSLVYDCPSLQQIREYSEAELDTLWDEIKRFTYPQTYYVDLSREAAGSQAEDAGRRQPAIKEQGIWIRASVCLTGEASICPPFLLRPAVFPAWLLPAHHIEDVRRQRDLAGDDIAVEKQHEQLKALIGRQRFAEQVMMPLMEDEQPFVRVRELCIRPCAALQRDDLVLIAMQDEHRTEAEAMLSRHVLMISMNAG